MSPRLKALRRDQIARNSPSPIVRRPSQHDSGCQPDPPASQRGVDTQRGFDNATLDTAPAAASCGALRRAAAAPCQRCAEASAPRGAVRVPGLRGVRSRCEEGDGVDSKLMASAVGLAPREKQPRRARRLLARRCGSVSAAACAPRAAAPAAGMAASRAPSCVDSGSESAISRPLRAGRRDARAATRATTHTSGLMMS